jgi:hypothetical protein
MAMEVKQRDIKEMIAQGMATDVTKMGNKEVNDLRRECDCVARSFGIYGINGAIMRRRSDGELFAVPSRSGNVLIVGY